MAFRSIDRHFLTGLAVSGFMIALAGCQSGNNSSDTLAVAGDQGKAKVSESDLRAFCPPITLREGTAYFNTYARGGQDDPSKVVYQASITDVTRNCSRSDGTLTMNVAVAGKVVPGPAGTAGTVKMPIRVVVVRGEEVLYSKLHNFQTTISDTSSATQFVFNDPAVSIPVPAESDLRIYAGYDEGPPKKQ
jgi:hypothetical protein